MGDKIDHSGKPAGLQYEKKNDISKSQLRSSDIKKNRKESDDDLIIEDNTVYEIDRECVERLKRQKKR